MKNFIFTLAFAIALFIAPSMASAQNEQNNSQSVQTQQTDKSSAEYNFSKCREHVMTGDSLYNQGDYKTAMKEYDRAIDCNNNYKGKKFMSDSKLEKRISNCNYAIAHGDAPRRTGTSQKGYTIADSLFDCAVSTLTDIIF